MSDEDETMDTLRATIDRIAAERDNMCTRHERLLTENERLLVMLAYHAGANANGRSITLYREAANLPYFVHPTWGEVEDEFIRRGEALVQARYEMEMAAALRDAGEETQ